MGVLGTSVAWNLDAMFQNGTNFVEHYGGYALVLLGTTCVLYGLFMAACKLLNPQTRTSWITVVMAIIVGGLFAKNGYGLVVGMAEGANDTINGLNTVAMLNGFNFFI